ncbi:hypothetical protein SHIRM173S_03714 [Streptomyces hirsutus]
MANVVGQDAAGRSTRTLRAEGALATITTEPEAPDRVRRVLEQALVFAGAALVAVYTPSEDGEQLCLVESAGVPRTLCGVRDSYSVAGHSPAAEAARGGQPVWLGLEELAAQAQARRVPARDFSLAALPVRHGAGGCLLAVSERPGGFDPDDRVCLGLVAGKPKASAGKPPAAAASCSSRPCRRPGGRCRSAAANRCGRNSARTGEQARFRPSTTLPTRPSSLRVTRRRVRVPVPGPPPPARSASVSIPALPGPHRGNPPPAQGR